MIETAGAGWSPGLLANLQVPAAVHLGGRPIVDPSELDHQVAARGAAPLHAALGAVEKQHGASVEPIAEVCQGHNLDSSVESEGTTNLAHPDHLGGLARSTNTRLWSRSDATRTSVRSASMLRPALPMNRPTSASASFTLIATVPPPRSNDSTSTSSGFSASDLATYSTSAR